MRSLLILAAASVASACTGMSCTIADYSGSTGVTEEQALAKADKTQTDTPGGKCIKAWWDSKFAYHKRSLGEIATVVQQRDLAVENCLPYTFIFARGTLEPGNLGVTVGPKMNKLLTAAEPGKWNIIGVPYDPLISGDYCVGIPGGKIAAKLIDDVAKLCPNTKIIVSGYSQGAMVAHIGVAFAKPEAKKQIAGVLLFGDPFNGAPIAGYPESKVKTYCASGDEVCNGKFVIKAAHLSYASRNTKEAAQWAENAVKAA